MDLQIVILSEVSQTEKEKYHMTSWNLERIDTNVLNKTETDSQTWRTALWLPSGRALEREGLGGLLLKRESERKVHCSVASDSLRPHGT